MEQHRADINFNRMDAFNFVYYAMTHKEDIDRCLEHFYNLPRDVGDRVLMHNAMWYKFREN